MRMRNGLRVISGPSYRSLRPLPHRRAILEHQRSDETQGLSTNSVGSHIPGAKSPLIYGTVAFWFAHFGSNRDFVIILNRLARPAGGRQVEVSTPDVLYGKVRPEGAHTGAAEARAGCEQP